MGNGVTRLALAILIHRPFRSLMTVLGVVVAFFLSCAQLGLMVGWCNTVSALIRHTDADLWFMAQQTSAYDYGTAIPRTRLYQVRNLPGIESAEPLFMAWNIWQRPDGRRVNVELVGLSEKMLGGPWAYQSGDVSCLRKPNTVIVDELYLSALGASGIGDTVDMMGRRATIGAISKDIRTFTASPFVFTKIDDAVLYDKRYSADEITYVMAHCRPGVDIHTVQQEARARVPNTECLTSHEFSVRSMKYWMLETGVGITVVLTAFLGFAVGTVIVSQTLYAATQENIHHFATLLAIGFQPRSLVGVVLLMASIVSVLGMIVGGLLFSAAAVASARTPIPLQTTPTVMCGLVVFQYLACLLASILSIKLVLRTDPVSVFNQ